MIQHEIHFALEGIHSGDVVDGCYDRGTPSGAFFLGAAMATTIITNIQRVRWLEKENKAMEAHIESLEAEIIRLCSALKGAEHLERKDQQHPNDR